MSGTATLKRFIDQRAKSWAEAQDIRARLQGEDENLSAADQETWIRALDEVDRLDKLVEAEERSTRMDAADVATTNARDAAPEETREVDDDAAYARAFDGYIRGGLGSLDREDRQRLVSNANPFEMRAPQASSPGSAGGYLIPTDMLQRLVETLKAYGGLLNVANVMTTATGNPLQWPTNDDTAAKGRIIGENAQVSQVAVTFGQNDLGAYTYTSDLFLCPWTLLQDSAFDLEGFLSRKAGERIGRAVAEHLAIGDGSGKPQGLMTGATIGKTGAISATAAITYDDLIDLEHSVDPAYRERPGVRYVFSDGALKLLRKLKDLQDRPLWQPSLQAGVASNMNGYPYTIDNGIAAPAAAATSIGFGDVSAAFLVRQVSGGQLVRLEERYADFLQTGYFAFMRLDSVIDDAAAFRTFKHGAAS